MEYNRCGCSHRCLFGQGRRKQSCPDGSKRAGEGNHSSAHHGDGDTVFCLSTAEKLSGDRARDITAIGSLAAETLAAACGQERSGGKLRSGVSSRGRHEGLGEHATAMEREANRGQNRPEVRL